MIATHDRATNGAWKWFLLSSCMLALLVTLTMVADVFGFVGAPWYGYWDANGALVGRAYIFEVTQPSRNGAAARAGFRQGDLLDLREQGLEARVALVYQLVAGEPTLFRVHRGASIDSLTIVGSTIRDGPVAYKLPRPIALALATGSFIACAFLIAFRRWWNRDARTLALILLLLTGELLDPTHFVLPSPSVSLIFLLLSRFCVAIAAALLVVLTSRFGRKSRFRFGIERVTYVAIVLSILPDALTVIGLWSLAIDPLPYVLGYSWLRNGLQIAIDVLLTVAAMLAVTTTSRVERARTAWLLLPVPASLLVSAGLDAWSILATSWSANTALQGFAAVFRLLGALMVTYAVVKRRVLDLEFVLSRTLVAATVSVIVVVPFVLLEWILSTVLANASHATGLLANGALALVTALSMRPIHNYIDALVDQTIFRKRYEDERALRDFSHEAAYVTDRNALLELATENLRAHTDAHGGAILLRKGIGYVSERSFGDMPAGADENDAAVLALQTWHRPVDPHQYVTTLKGALAIPIVIHGHLLGIVLLGERLGGEAFAPDDVNAMEQFAHGVGLALNTLADVRTRNDFEQRVTESIASLRQSVATLSELIVERARESQR